MIIVMLDNIIKTNYYEENFYGYIVAIVSSV